MPEIERSRIDGAIDRAVRDAEPSALALLRRLIATPSLTGGEGVHNGRGTVAGLPWSSLQSEPGIEQRADSVLPGGDHVMALLRGSGRGVAVLDAHTDTVSPGDPAVRVGGDPYSAGDAEIVWLGDDRLRVEVAAPLSRSDRSAAGWAACGRRAVGTARRRSTGDGRSTTRVRWSSPGSPR